MARNSQEVSAPFEPPSSVGSFFGDLDCWRSTGCDLATGGEVEGEAFSAVSEESSPARALCIISVSS